MMKLKKIIGKRKETVPKEGATDMVSQHWTFIFKAEISSLFMWLLETLFLEYFI